MHQGTAQAEYHEGIDVRAVRAELLAWYRVHRRDLPWRRASDPYAIWLSETMLQQTRVTAVLPYYARFLERFPSPEALANAPEAELLACWAGLGYYTRARNLQRAAKTMTGGFPRAFAAIRTLPGVGDYTAAAVASIAFGLPHAAVDGNVLRVLSRLYGDATDIARPAGRTHFAKIADELLDRENPGDFNQAVMELGGTVCTPKNPQCLVCALREQCVARRSGTQASLPVKIVTKKQVSEERTVFWIERDGQVLAWKRGPNERLMAGFWELPEHAQLPHVVRARVLGNFKHGITFHDYRFRVVETDAPDVIGDCEWIALSELDKVAVSTVFRKAVRIKQADTRSLVAQRG